MLPLTGYADRLSVRPGETIRFHLSNATGADVDVKIARVVCADPNPAGPGIILEPVESSPVACGVAGEERSPRGSYARIDDPKALFWGGQLLRDVPPLPDAARRCAAGDCLAHPRQGRADSAWPSTSETGCVRRFGDGTSMRDVAEVESPLDRTSMACRVARRGRGVRRSARWMGGVVAAVRGDASAADRRARRSPPVRLPGWTPRCCSRRWTTNARSSTSTASSRRRRCSIGR